MSTPPLAPQKPKTLENHTDQRVDPWFWLRDLDDPDTMPYLEAENDYTDQIMAPSAALQEELFTEMRARIKEEDSSVPQQEGEYFYYSRFEKNGQYPVYCRKRGDLDAEEEVILDVNALAKGRDYLQIGVCKNSPDHRFLAYSTDTDGSESYTIQLKDLKTGQLLPETIAASYYSLEWAADSGSFFYDRLDQHHRPVEIYQHQLHSDPAKDPLVYQEGDKRFFVELVKAASGRFIYIGVSGNNMSEWHYLDATSSDTAPVLIAPRKPDFEYEVADWDQVFFIRHNGDGAKDFKIVQAPIASPHEANWRDFLPAENGRPLLGLHLFSGHMAVSCRRAGLPTILVIDLKTKAQHQISFSETAYFTRIIKGRQWDTDQVRFVYSSLTTPETIYDYQMSTRQRKLRKKTEILGDFDPGHYEPARLQAPARDGTPIPISLLYRKGTIFDGSAPLYLYAYGSYGNSTEASFRSTWLSLVKRGFIVAIAHVRGGMEMGWDWYENGKLLKKRNTFSDFNDCAQYLIDTNYTAKGRIAAMGGSAGGLLMGAATNQCPELYGAVIAHVPFVDALNTMLDDTLPLTTVEYNEWGNPNDKAYYDYIKSYSPYDNVTVQDYPHLLITAGLSDPRVTYWEPAKWTARLRHLKTDKNLLLLKTYMEAGHGGASGRFDHLRETAFEYAFILKALANHTDPLCI